MIDRYEHIDAGMEPAPNGDWVKAEHMLDILSDRAKDEEHYKDRIDKLECILRSYRRNGYRMSPSHLREDVDKARGAEVDSQERLKAAEANNKRLVAFLDAVAGDHNCPVLAPRFMPTCDVCSALKSLDAKDPTQ